MKFIGEIGNNVDMYLKGNKIFIKGKCKNINTELYKDCVYYKVPKGTYDIIVNEFIDFDLRDVSVNVDRIIDMGGI